MSIALQLDTFKRIDGPSRVAFAYLHDSPTQPRQFYDEAYIQQLADSIKINGDILQPLMVRNRMPNPLRTEWDPEDGYEVIFGHCRKRAGILAGLDGAPIQVVEMTDHQVLQAQLAENIARKDLHFLDAAEGLARLRREFDVPVSELENRTGMSRTAVYNMIKLADACPAVKQACRDGKLDQEIAIVIARIPAHKLQDGALKIALEKKQQHDGRGYRDTRRELLDKYSLYLKDALWALDDAFIVPSAGACTTCPDRSGSTPELFGDVLEKKDYYWLTKHGHDVCMNPECFALKKKTQLELDARELENSGKTVVTGNAARQALTAGGDVKGSYVAVTEVKALLKGIKGEARPKTVLIQDQRSGKTVEAVKRADLAGAGVAMDEVKPGRDAAAERQKQKQEENRAKIQAEEDARKALLKAVLDAMRTTPRTPADLRAVARFMVESAKNCDTDELVASFFGKSGFHDLDDAIDTMSRDELGLLVMAVTLAEHVEVYGVNAERDTPLHAAALEYGVDDAEVLSTPLSAAQAQEEGDDEGEKSAPDAGAGADGTESRGKAKVPNHVAWPFPKERWERPSAVDQTDDTAKPSGQAVDADAMPEALPGREAEEA
jgi:ParB/RepB/Spo0J family partition protein